MMIGVFRSQDMGMQPSCGNATFDRPTRRWCLHDAVSAGARLLAAYMSDQLEGATDGIELLRNVFAQGLEFAAAFRACLFQRLMNLHVAFTACRQWPPYRFIPGRLCHRCVDLSLAFLGQQVFQARLKYVDLALEFLRFPAELRRKIESCSSISSISSVRTVRVCSSVAMVSRSCATSLSRSAKTAPRADRCAVNSANCSGDGIGLQGMRGAYALPPMFTAPITAAKCVRAASS